MNRYECKTDVTLRGRLSEGGPLSLEEASSVLDRLAEAIDTANLQGVLLHNALSPENILLLPDGGVQIRTSGSASAYYSPEAAWNTTPTSATDIWALGALLYEMLTCLVPLPAMHPTALAAPGARWGARRLPGAISCAQAVIDRALTRSPESRYSSAQAMANALWEIVPQAGFEPAPAPAPAVDVPVTVSSAPAAPAVVAAPKPAIPAANVSATAALATSLSEARRKAALIPCEPTSMQRMYQTISAQRAPLAS